MSSSSSAERLRLVAASAALALARRSRCARPPPQAPPTRLLDEAAARERGSSPRVKPALRGPLRVRVGTGRADALYMRRARERRGRPASSTGRAARPPAVVFPPDPLSEAPPQKRKTPGGKPLRGGPLSKACGPPWGPSARLAPPRPLRGSRPVHEASPLEAPARPRVSAASEVRGQRSLEHF